MRDEMPSKLDVIAVSLRATRGVALSYDCARRTIHSGHITPNTHSLICP
jgi:hypothetical protein